MIPKQSVYVCNLKTESVSVIDLASRTLVKNIKVGRYPIYSLYYPHAQGKLIVTLHNYERKEGDAVLELVDLNTLDITQKIQYPRTAIPSGIVYDRKRDILFIADENDEQGYVHVHDGTTLEKLSSLSTGRATVHLDISSDGKYLVATNRLSADLSLFDLEQNPITSLEKVSISLGDPNTYHPFDVKFAGNYICYVTDYNTGELLVVDVIRRMVTDRIKVGEKLFGISLDRNGETAYICNLAKPSVYIVDLNSKEVDEVKGLNGRPSHCVIDEKGQQLVVACQDGSSGGAVNFIDLKTKKIIASVTDEKIQACIGVTYAESGNDSGLAISFPQLIRYATWAWIIMLGAIMITPGGISCPACAPGVTTILGIISIGLGTAGIIANQFQRSQQFSSR